MGIVISSGRLKGDPKDTRISEGNGGRWEITETRFYIVLWELTKESKIIKGV